MKKIAKTLGFLFENSKLDEPPKGTIRKGTKLAWVLRPLVSEGGGKLRYTAGAFSQGPPRNSREAPK